MYAVDGSAGSGVPERVVELYDAVIELEAAVIVRQHSGWLLLSAGEVRPGRWWAEYERIASGTG